MANTGSHEFSIPNPRQPVKLNISAVSDTMSNSTIGSIQLSQSNYSY
jgi:hypothetical protein